MKNLLFSFFIALAFSPVLLAQDKEVHPSFITTGEYHGLSQPLRDLPALTPDEWEKMEIDAAKPRNEGLQFRQYPFAETALPRGNDPVWQQEMGKTSPPKAPIVSFAGQPSPYYPPDANGVAGPNHYMQTINTVYAIYSKTGALVAGPTNMNLLFSGVTGSGNNDGDPVVLYDKQADRWVAIEFSISGSNDYMLVAVSQTNDPTGSWYRYSFDVDDMPDYPKIGVWQDGYYMGTNCGAKDIYVMERSKMLSGLTPQMVGFNNPSRPASMDGFMCVPPVDNDGTFAPAGSPGLFIAFNDDAIGGGADQLWIYQLAVDWTTPASSTFSRIQQLAVPPFTSDFGNNWDNIKQNGTTQELDAIPQVIMNTPQYRNFGTYQTLVCCHTVDVDNTDHAGIRWYELRKTTGTWSLRQTGTYAPDAHSRWMGSIRLNGQNEIGLGYSISSTTLYPGIRYTGQSATAYAAGTGVLDLAEQTVITGANYQSSYNRWGDYSSVTIDPANDKTFWFTTEYIGSGGARKTQIFSFEVGSAPAQADLVVQNPAATPSSIPDGSNVTASCTVLNQGAASAGSCNLKYYLSTDNTYSAGDILLATDVIPVLNASGYWSFSKPLTIPSGTLPGTYYIVFFADADGQVTEVSENNNAGSAQVVVTSAAGLADLVVINPGVNPSSLNPGNTTTATCTVKNLGPGSAGVSSLKYYLSGNTTYETGDTYLATDAVTALAANGTSPFNKTLTIPSTTGVGTWYILFIADADGQVPEVNELNNLGYTTITVKAPQGCNSTTMYPSKALSTTTSWKYQKSINAGEYTAFNVTVGKAYVFSYCSTDGGSASYNSEMTLRNKANDALLAYNDDFCGDDAKITWTATFTGVVKLVTTVSGCGTNRINTTLAYKRLTKAPEDMPENVTEEFLVYPNPTSGKISVEAKTSFEGMEQIAVYEMNGKMIKRIPIPEKADNLYTIDLENNPEGYYLVQIKGPGTLKQYKIFVTR
ncbi:MAG: T9SS type A sorting domain-containing protein [Bacteroidetes bacterium]|nr:T9SS type A sorting domain-containing protein [Bacteroidota bacterium]